MSNKLYRSRSNKMIAGICGGIGEYFSIDPTIIRLILIILVFLGLSGVLFYIIAWIVIPEEPNFLERKPSKPKSSNNNHRTPESLVKDSDYTGKTQNEVVPDYEDDYEIIENPGNKQ